MLDLSIMLNIREFQQGFTTDLPQIYHKSTKDLPKIYQVYQTPTNSLPTASKIFFQFTKDLPQIYQHNFGVKYFRAGTLYC